MKPYIKNNQPLIADFADLTLIFLLKLMVELQKTVRIEKNQR
jgi:hypothetical protein